MTQEKEDHWWEKVLHLEERAKHHEDRLDDHEDRLGKLYSMVHDIVVNIAVMSMEHGVWRKLLYGAVAIVLSWVGGRLLGLI